jgi:hypothetical protein
MGVGQVTPAEVEGFDTHPTALAALLKHSEAPIRRQDSVEC